MLYIWRKPSWITCILSPRSLKNLKRDAQIDTSGTLDTKAGVAFSVSIVHFLAYRNYEKSRVEANNAMMAMLAGSRLAEHTLGLASGSQRTLPEIFPAVEHIGRMNLRVDAARRLLANAESHLSAMAVPYALALHEDYVTICLKLLQRARRINGQEVRSASPKTMHQKFEAAADYSLSMVSVEQFDFLRLLRNAIIHAGGLPSADLLTVSGTLSTAAVENWEELTGFPPSALVESGRPVVLNQGELIAALAITKSLAEQLNEGLQKALPRDVWADLACEDFRTELSKYTHEQQRARKLPGYARKNYSAIGLSAEEIKKAIQRMAC
ncbi:hypothetical protein [Streptomyces mirabilis]|uniref:hypothetical protein n=1 Tax=Streptomyces mirabilis TaxID=68239 RepID=UPI0036D7AF90